MAWVLFVRASEDDRFGRFGRMLETGRLEPGSSYSILVGDRAGEYVYDGERFVHADKED
jgi:hypothetical protein